jgi:HSP20 family protein
MKNILTIKGERKDLSEVVENSLFSKREISYGQYQKQISLGIDVDSEKIKASYIDGVLELVIPKSEKTKLRKISIE